MSLSLSVILLNYNYARYLGDAIDAVLKQSYQPLEFILIDDASTDDSVQVIKKKLQDCPYAKVIYHNKNQGIFSSVEEGFSLARGECIATLASDDQVLPGFFEKTMSVLQKHKEIGLCCSEPFCFQTEKLDISKIPIKDFKYAIYSPNEVVVQAKDNDLWVAGHTTIYRKDLFIKYGGLKKEHMQYSDWYLNHKIAFLHGMGYIFQPLSAMRWHSNTFTKKMRSDQKNFEKIFSAVFSSLYQETKFLQKTFNRSALFSFYGYPIVKFMIKRPRAWKFLFPILRKRKNRIWPVIKKRFLKISEKNTIIKND